MLDQTDEMADALRRLVEALRTEVARHPQLPPDILRRRELSIALTLNLGRAATDPATQATELRQNLHRELEALVIHRQAFRPGHVLDLNTGTAEGKDTRPPDGRFVFGGYTPSGRPRFLDFAQYLLQLEHPDQHLLYRKPPGLVTVVTPGKDLVADLLPVYAEAPADTKIHGQVTAGWYPIPRTDGSPGNLAVTLQAVSTARPSRNGGARRSLGLNLLVAGPDGESLDEVYARLDPVPWTSAVQWARKALASVEKAQATPKGRDTAEMEKRIAGILAGTARRLAQKQRGRIRRTDHAEKRHQSGERPTRQAMRDLDRAQDRDIFVDPRKDTLIVLGDRGRAHVFNRAGKLVTSIRYRPEAIERKRKAEIWCPAAPGEIRSLREDAVRHGFAD